MSLDFIFGSLFALSAAAAALLLLSSSYSFVSRIIIFSITVEWKKMGRICEAFFFLVFIYFLFAFKLSFSTHGTADLLFLLAVFAVCCLLFFSFSSFSIFICFVLSLGPVSSRLLPHLSVMGTGSDSGNDLWFISENRTWTERERERKTELILNCDCLIFLSFTLPLACIWNWANGRKAKRRRKKKKKKKKRY